jgi:hypothetical protein
METTTPTEKVSMPKVDSTLREEKLPMHRIRPLYRMSQIVWYVLGLVEILLALRFLLKLFGANSGAGFTKFIYGASALFAAPFLYVFKISQVEGSIFEWSTILAMAVYLLVAWLIVKAIVMGKPVSTKEADQKLPGQGKL